MNNKRTINSAFVLVLISLAVLFTASGCDELLITTVPSWAKGEWSPYQYNGIVNQVKFLEITSKKFIPRDELALIPNIEEKEVTIVLGDTVWFDLITVEKKGTSNDQIVVGLSGTDIKTLYRIKYK